MLIIAAANGKGGTGKSPLVKMLTNALKRRNLRCLIVDIDPQASESQYFLGETYDEQPDTMFTALTTGEAIPPVIVDRDDAIHLLPATNRMAPLQNAETVIRNKPNFQRMLAKILREYEGSYDVVIIDTPGNVSIFTMLALAAAHLVVVPVKTEKSSVEATPEIMALIEQVKEYELNTELAIWGIIPTLFQGHIKTHQRALERLKEMYGDLVYSEPSRQADAYNKAIEFSTLEEARDVSDFDPELGKYWDTIADSVLTRGAKYLPETVAR